jgi:cysteine desulfuration protein SufE
LRKEILRADLLSADLSIPARLQEILDELKMFPDRAERIDYLIELSHQYNHAIGEDVPRDEAHRVPGCESEVYMDLVDQRGSKKIRFAVDNPQGLSAMVMTVILSEGLEGATLEEILAVPESMVLDIFGNELSMGKSLGLTNMVRMMKKLYSS